MAPRLSKRQQRELEELNALSGGRVSGGITPVDSESEDELDEEPQVLKSTKLGFTAVRPSFLNQFL